VPDKKAGGKVAANLPPDSIVSQIFSVRGQRVMLAQSLAVLYEVEPRVLIQAVKRNLMRFPEDFMFQLAAAEFDNLKSHFVISSWGGSRVLPYAFTEQGVAMLSGVLRSERAIAVNIEIMRAFVQLRSLLESNRELASKLADLEKKYDAKFGVVFDAIKQLMNPPTPPKKQRIGFVQD
jgi:hypothetical protein